MAPLLVGLLGYIGYMITDGHDKLIELSGDVKAILLQMTDHEVRIRGLERFDRYDSPTGRRTRDDR